MNCSVHIRERFKEAMHLTDSVRSSEPNQQKAFTLIEKLSEGHLLNTAERIFLVQLIRKHEPELVPSPYRW